MMEVSNFAFLPSNNVTYSYLWENVNWKCVSITNLLDKFYQVEVYRIITDQNGCKDEVVTLTDPQQPDAILSLLNFNM